MATLRTDLEQEIVNALVDSNAVNFDAIGGIISKYGARAAKSGTDLTAIVNKHSIIACGWPGPELGGVAVRQVGETVG